MTTVEFRGDLWLQKTRVPRLSCGVVYVILTLAVLVELQLVTDSRTDGRTDGRTDRHRAMASTADAQHRAVKSGHFCLAVNIFNSLVYCFHMELLNALMQMRRTTL